MTTATPVHPVETIFHDAQSRLVEALEAAFRVPNAIGWSRVEVVAEPVDMLNWLRRQSFAQRVFWADRHERVEVAGVGAAHVLHQPSWAAVGLDTKQLFAKMHAVISDEHPFMRFYGGVRFDATCAIEEIWEPYGDYHFTLPRFEMINTGERFLFACNFHTDESLSRLQAELAQLSWDDTAPNRPIPQPIKRFDHPDRDRWHDNINAALNAFERGDANKIVLARKVTVDADVLLEPTQILKMLRRVTPNSFHFCYQVDDYEGYIGASPERLFRRDGQLIYSEALAGTRRRGATPEQDQALADDLYNSVKERHEHRLVLDSILDEFAQVCDSVQTDGETHVHKLAQLQHLYCRVEGVLREGVNDAEIIDLMHPTPAVGGFPRPVALRMLQELEPFERGWYAAPVGWVGKDSAEFCVAIRSGLVHADQLTVYSGAGIVAGSTPEQEWNEIENKLLNFRKALL